MLVLRRALQITLVAAGLGGLASCAAPSAAGPATVLISEPAPAPSQGAAPLAPVQVAARADEADAPPLAGTTWAGTDSDGDAYVFVFRPDGVLQYTSPTGDFDNGTWSQEGNRVTWEMNGRYAEYEGTFSGKTMRGKARNKAGKKWTWSVVQKHSREGRTSR